ncbi:MAG: PD40 domain-containing protein [Ignavibacteriales bacterium]|nr:PD40 domain-containing protein [Ignavibacteriales bacterium]
MHPTKAKTRVSIMLFLFTLFVSALPRAVSQVHDSAEGRLRNIRQLTFGGTNAEAYFSFDETRLVFQSTRSPFECDQIFVMNVDGSGQTLISNGLGNTTCAYFYPDGQRVLFASTFAANVGCFPRPDKSKGYVWGVWNAYDIYSANVDGTDLRLLTSSDRYDAEATISPAGDKIVFTSSRDGDLELYTMNLDGSDVQRITHQLGYDGGAFFSWDGKKVVYRAYHHTDSTEIAEYKALLAEQLVRPTKMEIFICDADGKNRRQITKTGSANFAPFFHPDNERVIYSSNRNDPKGRSFHLYLWNDDAEDPERITFGGSFNAFPMFTRDGKKLVFVSDRNATSRYEFNIFIADWVD